MAPPPVDPPTELRPPTTGTKATGTGTGTGGPNRLNRGLHNSSEDADTKTTTAEDDDDDDCGKSTDTGCRCKGGGSGRRKTPEERAQALNRKKFHESLLKGQACCLGIRPRVGDRDRFSVLDPDDEEVALAGCRKKSRGCRKSILKPSI